MRILFVLEHFHPYIGGVEELFKTLGLHLVQQGHSVEVITTRFDRKLPKQETIDGMKVFRIAVPNRFLFTIAALPVVYRHAARADIVHTTSYNAAWPAYRAARFRRKPVVVTFHEVWGALWAELPFLRPWQRWAYARFERLLLKLPFDRFVAVSEATRKALVAHGVPERRVAMIHNAVDSSVKVHMHRPPAEGFIFTYYGRLGPSKGLDVLIPGAAGFLEKHSDAHFRLIIPKRPIGIWKRVSKMLADIRFQGRVDLYHELPREELLQLVSGSSCVVVPSYSEGFCFVAAEAVTMGVPLVHSGRGALSETTGGKQIRFTELRPDAVDNALEEAYHKNWLETPVNKFPVETFLAKYLAVYRDLQTEKPR